MDASFAPQYIFLLKSICIMSQIPLHGSIFSMFLTEKNKSRAVRKPLPSHQEHCLAPRNRYAASLRPETVTIPQRVAERLVSSVICRLQGLSYSHVPECIEFSFILFIHHNIHFYFELCTYCNILDIYLSWNMNSVKYLFIWNYWIIYFVTCLEVFWSVMS